MTRKDYVLIAEKLKANRPDQDDLAGYDDATVAVADALGADNFRFDRVRFLKAAGVLS